MVQDRRSVRQASSGEPKRAGVPESEVTQELRGAAEDLVGAEEWKGSKLGYLTGVGAIRRGFSFVGAAVGSGFGQLQKFYAAMLGRGGADDDVEGVAVEDASERFLESMRIHGKSVRDLDQIQNSTWRGCLFFGGMTVLALAFGLGSYLWAPNDAGLWSPFDFAYRFVAVAPLAAFALKWDYVNWIVRRRRYDGLVEFLKSGEWMPQRARPARKDASRRPRDIVKRAAVVLLLAGVVAMAAAPTLHAQTNTTNPPAATSPGMKGPDDIFKKPGDKDLFMNMLSMIAPNVGPVPGFQGQAGSVTPAHTAMAAGFMAFISALFFLAGMQVAWHTISGIVATAQEGKVLGQKWHLVWAPIRVVSGVGFLAPALGGFCVAQVVVLYLIAFGGQLANLIWTPYVETMVSGMATPTAANTEGVATTIGQLTSSNDVLRSVFEKELCHATALQYNKRNGYQGGAVPQNVEWNQDYSFKMPIDSQQGTWSKLTTTLSNSTNALLGPTVTVTGQTLDYGPICGKITVPVTTATASDPPPDVAAAVVFSQARMDAIDAVRGVLQPIAKKAGESYQNYQAAAGGGSTNGLYFSPESSGPQGGNGGSGSVQELKNAFQKARSAYEQKMTDAARDLMNGVGKVTGGTLTQFAQDAKDGGWATAGVYYLTISRIQSSIFAKASEQPIITPMDLSKASPSLSEALIGTQGKPGAMEAFATWANGNIAQVATDATDNPINPYGARAGATDIQNTNPITTIFNKLDFGGVGRLLSKMQPSPLNPLGDIINLGHTIIDTAWVVLGAIAAVSAAANGVAENWVTKLTTLGSSSGITTVLSLVSPLIIVLIMAVFAMGITMAFIIPMIPYIMVLFFIIGMLVLTLEAMIAAPLWAFFHVRMDGQDLIDQVQRPGYMIAFNLLLRPALMMLGYIMSFFAFGAVAWFISVTFGAAVTAATAGFFGGPITFVVMGGMMAYLYYQAAIRCFTMIVQVPDRVTRWFGVGGENLGEESHGHAAAGMVVGQVGNRVEGSLAPSVGNALSGRNRLPSPGGNKAVANAGGGPDSEPGGGGGGGGKTPSGGGVRAAVDAGVQANEPRQDMPPNSPSSNNARGANPIAEKGTANQPAGGSRGAGGGSGGAAGSPEGGGGSTSDGYSASTAPPSGGAPDKGAPNAPASSAHAAPAPSSTQNPGSASRIRPQKPPPRK